ncbi:MAG: hypothetical protein GTN76_07860 [Candidatus Aenigmarchaeota archaeon]|nr:hypothetical protein [Candidatus Aenigmarchaeota archaeon]
MKDPRFYILPIISIILIAVILFRPDITGLVVGAGEPADGIKHLTGKVRITIYDTIIPEDSVVTIFLGDQSSSMPIKEFIEKSGGIYEVEYGRIPDIGYEGYGYAGEHFYTLDLSEFDLDLDLEPGEYTLITEVSYENFVISSTAEDIVV